MNGHLFDPGPGVPLTKMSPDVKRTARNNAIIASGRNPATMLKIIDGDHTCGDCAHSFAHTRSKTYWKCDQHREGVTFGPGTDIRLSWPACELFKE